MSILRRKVLQLTASYEPDRLIETRRARPLVCKGKAQAVEVDATLLLRSAQSTFEVPSVIRLIQYHDLRKRRRESGKQRFRIFVRDNFRCQFCSKKRPVADLTLDHIHPRSRGGSDEPENLATSCVACNQRKGNRTPEARMPLLATPSALKYGLNRAMLLHYAQARPEWRPYLFLEEQAA